MSERWSQASKKILEQIEKLEKVEEKDRLDYVRSLRFMLVALHRSLLGWMQWANNPDIMAGFSKSELEEMNKKMSEFARAFIEYDLEVTEKGAEKGVKAVKRVKKRRREETGTFYI